MTESKNDKNLVVPEGVELCPFEEILAVERIEPYGLFLENGGFVHVSEFHKVISEKRMKPNTPFSVWFPKGCRLKVRLRKVDKHGLTEKIIGIHYDLLEFADVIDVGGDVVLDTKNEIGAKAKKLLLPKP